MNRYETLLISLLQSIDQKLGGLLEVSQNAEKSGEDCADANQNGPDHV